MAGISVTVKGLASGGNTERIASRLANPKAVLGQIGQFGLRESRERLRRRIEHPARSKGNLLRSGHATVGATSVDVGYSAIYARIQQMGGTVRPKGGKKYIVLPVPDWLAKADTWPREWPKGQLKFVRRAEINFLGSTWYGPALVAHSEEQSEKLDTQRGAIQRKLAKRKAGERKRFGGLTGKTIDAEKMLMVKAETSAKAKKAKGIKKAKFGEVMYALVRSSRIPGDPYLTWTTGWEKFTTDALSKWLGFA